MSGEIAMCAQLYQRSDIKQRNKEELIETKNCLKKAQKKVSLYEKTQNIQNFIQNI